MTVPLEELAAPGSVMVADVSTAFDFLKDFGSSPLILLIPIGAGTVVALIVIYILVRSAG
jgi:hypothetical protein